jgi:hypothetical protein
MSATRWFTRRWRHPYIEASREFLCSYVDSLQAKTKRHGVGDEEVV